MNSVAYRSVRNNLELMEGVYLHHAIGRPVSDEILVLCTKYAVLVE